MLTVQAVATEAVGAVGPLVAAIARRDRDLAVQIRRAASSIILNIAEGEASDAGTSRARFHNAAGSAREVRAALGLAVTWRYINAQQHAPVEALLDRTSALLFRILNPKR
jgi:four helix bundle protein